MTYLYVAVGAAVGAPVRYLAGHVLDGRLPWGTLLVNVVGSFVLGLLSGLALDADVRALLGVGFCGGLTTYSAFAVQTVEHGSRRGVPYVVLTLAGALAACALGFALAT